MVSLNESRNVPPNDSTDKLKSLPEEMVNNRGTTVARGNTANAASSTYAVTAKNPHVNQEWIDNAVKGSSFKSLRTTTDQIGKWWQSSEKKKRMRKAEHLLSPKKSNIQLAEELLPEECSTIPNNIHPTMVPFFWPTSIVNHEDDTSSI